MSDARDQHRGDGLPVELDDEVAALLDERDGSGDEGGGRNGEGPPGQGENGAPPRPVTSVLGGEEVAKYRERWQRVQGEFIDDPRRSVEHADHLVDLVIQRLMDRLTSDRDQLARRWDVEGEPSTEDLRQALQGYRELMERLLHL